MLLISYIWNDLYDERFVSVFSVWSIACVPSFTLITRSRDKHFAIFFFYIS